MLDARASFYVQLSASPGAPCPRTDLAARYPRRGRGGPTRGRAARVPCRVHAAEPGQRSQLARSLLRAALDRAGAPRRAARLPRGVRPLPAAGRRPLRRRPPDGPYSLPSHGDDARGHQHDRGRRSRAASRAARGLPRGQLRLDTLPPLALDEHYEGTFRRPDSPLKLKPSEYFKRQCFVSVEAGEDFVKQIIE